MPDPFFSVVIPTYNRAGFIRNAIISVLNQSFEDFEVIVVDDGSTDNTEQVVKLIPDGRIRYAKKQNAERGAARNFGANMARGLFVNFFDSDDLLYPSHLETAYRFLKAHNVELCHLGYDVKNEEGRLRRSMQHIGSIQNEILSGNVLSCNGVFVKREIILQNPFNEDRGLSSLEDWELWIRLSARYSFTHVPKITSTIIDHDSRSVVTGQATTIETKLKKFINYVQQDPVNQKVFGPRLGRTFASANTYAALHLMMVNGSRRRVLVYVKAAVMIFPSIILTKRFLVILLMLCGIRR